MWHGRYLWQQHKAAFSKLVQELETLIWKLQEFLLSVLRYILHSNLRELSVENDDHRSSTLKDKLVQH